MKKLLMTIILVAATIFLFTGCSNKKEISICDEKRDQIEEKYGVDIFYKESETNHNVLDDVKVISDQDELKNALEELENVLSYIPIGFIDELKNYTKKTIKIVISESYISGVIFDNKDNEYWVIDKRNIKTCISKNMIYSAFWNINKLDNMEFLSDWDKYNPKDFRYGNIEEYSQYLFDGNNTYDTYFITKTMMESKYDDIECLFSYLWEEEYMKRYNTMAAPKIHAKFEYLCSELDRVFETVDENAYWARYIK